ncbi:DUF1040 family protein, partial [Salmonella enterica subsp. enterica serovar Anatum]|nr:DUF1040 family protein [Salmonella enterica subsp. enterica serovar Anatum]
MAHRGYTEGFLRRHTHDDYQKLAKESGFDGKLEDLTDDILIYHLKMRDSAKDAAIPGIQKD